MAAAKLKDSCSMDDLEAADALLALLKHHGVAHADMLQGKLCSVTFFPPAAPEDGGPVEVREAKSPLSPGMQRAFDIMKGKVPPQQDPEG